MSKSESTFGDMVKAKVELTASEINNICLALGHMVDRLEDPDSTLNRDIKDARDAVGDDGTYNHDEILAEVKAVEAVFDTLRDKVDALVNKLISVDEVLDTLEKVANEDKNTS